MNFIIILTATSLLLSLIFSRQKTLIGLKKGLTMFVNLLPVLLVVIILISIILYLVPNDMIIRYFGKEAGFLSYIAAAIIGSIALIPGFIAYPLAGVLVKSGVSYAVIAIFITTLMMVGFISIPLEAKYFGMRIAIIRNTLFLVGALIIGSIIGLMF
ncbi:MAG TPA: permease [Bacteroidales bacterium]|nr:permease [Bacteroidales bacterium]